MEQKYTCIFLKFRHPRMLRDLLTQNLQHQQTLQKSGCERPCGDHRHLLTVPSNHQREEKAQKHKTSCSFNVLCLLCSIQNLWGGAGGAFAAETARARQREL